MDFLLGVALGQVNDPSALVILSCQWPTTSEGQAAFQVRPRERRMPRWRLGSPACRCKFFRSR